MNIQGTSEACGYCVTPAGTTTGKHQKCLIEPEASLVIPVDSVFPYKERDDGNLNVRLFDPIPSLPKSDRLRSHAPHLQDYKSVRQVHSQSAFGQLMWPSGPTTFSTFSGPQQYSIEKVAITMLARSIPTAVRKRFILLSWGKLRMQLSTRLRPQKTIVTLCKLSSFTLTTLNTSPAEFFKCHSAFFAPLCFI